MSDFALFASLFYEYFKIGLFTIGGGYAMLPVVIQTIERTGWIEASQLLNFVGVAEATPGPFAINLATFVGLEVGKSTSLGLFGGIIGSFTATMAVVLPSLIIIIIATKLLDRFNTNRYVQGALFGIRPVVVGLVLSAVFTIFATVVLPNIKFTNLDESSWEPFNYTSLILLALFVPMTNIKIKGKKIHPILLIIFAAGLGVLLFGWLGIHK